MPASTRRTQQGDLFPLAPDWLLEFADRGTRRQKESSSSSTKPTKAAPTAEKETEATVAPQDSECDSDAAAAPPATLKRKASAASTSDLPCKAAKVAHRPAPTAPKKLSPRPSRPAPKEEHRPAPKEEHRPAPKAPKKLERRPTPPTHHDVDPRPSSSTTAVVSRTIRAGEKIPRHLTTQVWAGTMNLHRRDVQDRVNESIRLARDERREAESVAVKPAAPKAAPAPSVQPLSGYRQAMAIISGNRN
ncbi:MAG: hypothetical protein M1828_005185 [Chrysothrix sp. TS-e1954]|nr:MAG: hypothetical protein M1828_005185 [Chrysothrix sp. TS-e1954]